MIIYSIASPEVLSFIYELIMEDEHMRERDTPFTDFLASIRVHCMSNREYLSFFSNAILEGYVINSTESAN